MERKLSKDLHLQKAYVDFMEEYLSLNHMSIITSESSQNSSYFLPHHAVVRDKSSSTKVRVVFNASNRTSSGISLNDILMVGPTIQADLFSLLVQFRTHKIALTADITKMYRQINVNKSDRFLQQIYWRKSPDEPLETYELNTVTYGTSSAPYLAIRTLKQLAQDESLNYPQASHVLKTQFYVDDMLSGSSNVDDATKLKSEISQLLLSGGFELRKWCSNNIDVVPVMDRPDPVSISILGVLWNHLEDMFLLPQPNFSITSQLNKRQVLSSIVKLFDPIGLYSPVIFIAKQYIMQKLWACKLSWDEEIIETLLTEWIEFVQQLKMLSVIKIPRCIYSFDGDVSYELHGFCDASQLGYGCAIYIRTIDVKMNFQSRLLCAKSKISPLKKHTIPRLELCAALLLSELYNKVMSALSIKFSRVILYSDSEITLFRINSQPALYPVFVANRISRIQEVCSPNLWWHIPSKLNPADIVSRGALPSELESNNLWWNGPAFLYDADAEWPKSKFNNIDQLHDPEIVEPCNVVSTNIESTFFEEQYSDLNKMLRSVAIWLRFIYFLKSGRKHFKKGSISSEEVDFALMEVIKSVQHKKYEFEIKALKRGTAISKQSNILNLNPFLDETGLLRVGGRLENSNLCDDQKHQIILPKSKLANCIVHTTHFRNHHVGPQSLLYFTRQRFWIVDGKNVCNKIFRSCIRCARMRPKSIEQLMGQLPKERVQPFRPFVHVGVDFAGPFSCISKIRSNVVHKVYLAIFICFSTKAVHMEIVHDLSTNSFLSSFIRFINRRGRPSIVFSDNATNFIGSKSELKELQRLFDSEVTKNQLSKFFSEEGIKWSTIPPRSPHFGGLWEAAVKSAKSHIKSALGTHQCTIQEFETLSIQVEGILNSRPLTPLSNNIDDFSVLTPGHFIIGAPLNSIPHPSLQHLDFNRLNRYQRLQHCMEIFWKRWSNEYLGQLQKRHKWKSSLNCIKEGAFVVLRDENLPPMKWAMARIVKLHPGKDKEVRVVTVKTALGEFKRSIQKICLLPIETSNIPEND